MLLLLSPATCVRLEVLGDEVPAVVGLVRVGPALPLSSALVAVFASLRSVANWADKKRTKTLSQPLEKVNPFHFIAFISKV